MSTEWINTVDFCMVLLLTFCIKYATFFVQKAVTKTRGPGKIPREGAILVQGIRNTAGDDTTSELRGRNAPTGAPVKASMSGRAICNQGGTVEYFVSHP